jgi:hypothetical protein
LSSALTQSGGELAWQQALTGGEDYELCFSAPHAQEPAIAALALRSATAVTRIGLLEAGSGIELKLHNVVMRLRDSITSRPDPTGAHAGALPCNAARCGRLPPIREADHRSHPTLTPILL